MFPWRSAFRSRVARATLCIVAGALLIVRNPVTASADGCPTGRAPTVRAPVAPAPTDAPTLVHADSVRATPDGVTVFSGNVALQRGSQRVRAEQLHHDRNTGQVDAAGDVMFRDASGSRYQVPELHFNLQTHTGDAGPGTYELASGQGRGDMRRTQFEGPDHTRLTTARYTTCPLGQDDWFVQAHEIELDTAADVGTARHARVDFLGVPLLYVPYFTFPISDKRKSGFLIPEIGYDSRLGTVLGAPYYWNIAPNYDATLAPRLLTDRGLQLQNQFRYLGQDFSGQLDVEHLANDKLTGENRAAGTFAHNHTFNSWWSASANLRGVSDKDYLSDFGDNLNVTTQTHLPQNAEANYRGTVWTFTARAADYQTVDRTIALSSRPYARLPQLVLAALPPAGAGDMQYRLEGELVNFTREQSVTGQRAHLNPAVSMPLARPYGFVTTELGARQISYNLHNATEQTPSVSAPYVTIDSGIFFERALTIGAREYVQTLEPRIYYLYTPFRAQDHLPNFDTALPDFTFGNLFRNNRFVGGDRIGDANQMTLAVTTRFLDESDGAERLRASIGQIHYFDERRVNLSGPAVEDRRSDLAAELAAWLVGNWYASGSIQWNPYRDDQQRSGYQIQYQPAYDRIVNVGQRFIRGDIKQLDISAEWPLTSRWTVRARSLYSQRDNEDIESYAGLQYNACCWAVRVHTARRRVQATGAAAGTIELTRDIMFELELSGLGKLGAAPISPLKQSLFSFTPDTAETQAR